MRDGKRSSPLLCPSAQPEMTDAVVIGVVGGDAETPQLRPLERPLPVTPELLALAEPAAPTEVFRFSAPCLTAGCRHFTGRTATSRPRSFKCCPP